MESERDSGEECSLIADIIDRLRTRVAADVFGHERMTELLAGAFIIGGHVLLEGPPGIAKTLLARTFCRALGLTFNRIQFTPDLMPSDVTGVYVFDQSAMNFRLAPGPIFCEMLLADEINRTPPKTQAALLEAMQERFVTIDGKRHPLGDLFFVVATQNPVEHEGTYPLPEAQLDRFLFKLNLDYPSSERETSMIRSLSAQPEEAQRLRESNVKEQPAVTLDEIAEARRALREIVLDESIAAYIYRLAAASRVHPDLLLGASPRAALQLALAAKLAAASDRRSYVIPDDVKSMAPFVLPHRIVFRPEVFETPESGSKLVKDLLAKVPAAEAEAPRPRAGIEARPDGA